MLDFNSQNDRQNLTGSNKFKSEQSFQIYLKLKKIYFSFKYEHFCVAFFVSSVQFNVFQITQNVLRIIRKNVMHDIEIKIKRNS